MEAICASQKLYVCHHTSVIRIPQSLSNSQILSAESTIPWARRSSPFLLTFEIPSAIEIEQIAWTPYDGGEARISAAEPPLDGCTSGSLDPLCAASSKENEDMDVVPPTSQKKTKPLRIRTHQNLYLGTLCFNFRVLSCCHTFRKQSEHLLSRHNATHDDCSLASKENDPKQLCFPTHK